MVPSHTTTTKAGTHPRLIVKVGRDGSTAFVCRIQRAGNLQLGLDILQLRLLATRKRGGDERRS